MPKARSPEELQRATVVAAARKFFIRLGGHKLSPLVFPILAEVGAKEFAVKMEGIEDPTDLNFSRAATPEDQLAILKKITGKSISTRKLRRQQKRAEALRKYEGPPLVEQTGMAE